MTTKVSLDGQLTQREILKNEERSGGPIDQVPHVLTDQETPKMRLAAVLTLVALRRTEPAATLDTVLDGDYELEWAAPDEVAPPLPPPSAVAT